MLLSVALRAASAGFLSDGALQWSDYVSQFLKLLAPIGIGSFFQQVSHQFELGQDWVLSQRVVNNILLHRIVPIVTVGV